MATVRESVNEKDIVSMKDIRDDKSETEIEHVESNSDEYWKMRCMMEGFEKFECLNHDRKKPKAMSTHYPEECPYYQKIFFRR